MTDTTAFVTGGSGFIGQRLIPALRAEGYQVRALARSLEAERIVVALGAEAMPGELADVSSLTAAMEGCELAVHCAARFRKDGDYSSYYQDNVVGTQHVLDAAKAAGVKRLVAMGAAGCLLGGKPVQDADESWPLREPSYSPYFRTKTIADRMVRAAATESLATCVVRPAWVWGDDDPIFESIVEATTQGKMTFIDGGKHPLVTSHVDNTVHAILLALKGGAGGEAYFVFDDGTITFRDFVTRMLAARGIEAPNKSVRFAIAWAMATVMEAAWSLFRRPGKPPISRELVKMSGRPFVVSDRKARTELGYAPVISRDKAIAHMMQSALSSTTRTEGEHNRALEHGVIREGMKP